MKLGGSPGSHQVCFQFGARYIPVFVLLDILDILVLVNLTLEFLSVPLLAVLWFCYFYCVKTISLIPGIAQEF